jgi:hypothetical protein
MTMVKESPVRSWLLISSVSLLLFTGCGLWSRRVNIGEQFALRRGERVVVAGIDLVIQLEEVGHQTSPNPQPKGFSAYYVELKIMAGGAQPRSLTVYHNVNVGDYIITVESADPFRSDGGRPVNWWLHAGNQSGRVSKEYSQPGASE